MNNGNRMQFGTKIRGFSACNEVSHRTREAHPLEDRRRYHRKEAAPWVRLSMVAGDITDRSQQIK